MKKSEFRQLIREEIQTVLKEKREVYKTSEFEEIHSAINTIRENSFAFKKQSIRRKIEAMMNELETYVSEYGFETID